jgi:uncharacterized repeat protein (TIGR01451 family)
MKTKRYRRRRETLSWVAAAARLRWTAAAPAGSLWAARALTLFVGAFLLAGASGAFAQNTFDVGTNLVDVSRMKGNETDPAIAIDTLSPSNMFVAGATDGTQPGLFVAVTTNMGVRWTTNVIATNNDAQGLVPAYGEPSVAWDAYGNLFLAYLPASYEGVAIALSTNGGRNFTAFTNLAALDVTAQPRLAAPPSGAAAGSVWVVYKVVYTSANAPLQVQGLLSTGLGTNGVFSPVQVVPGSSSGGFADIAVGPLGEVLVAFQDNLENYYPAATVWVSVETNALTDGVFSTNGFSAAEPVVSDAIGGATYVEAELTGNGINAAVGVAWDCDSGETNYDKAYLVYTAYSPKNNLVINFCSSGDGGVTWSRETTLDDDAQSGNNDHFLPRMAVDPMTGIIGCFWYDCRNDQGDSSQSITNVDSDTFIFTNLMITNISISNNLLSGMVISTNAVDDTGQGVDWTVTIMGEDMIGTQLRSDNKANIYVYGPTNTNFFISLGTTNASVKAKVTVLVTNIFPHGYTLGTANQEAVPYATVSLDGGQTFLANQPLISLNQTINAPAQGIASGITGSDSLTGWGRYTALAGYGANFFPVWADNSDVTTNNPDGANTNFDLLMLAGGTGLSSVTIPTADLSIWVTNSPNPVISEGELTYILMVSNNGPKAAAPVTVTNLLSPDVTLVYDGVRAALGGTIAYQPTANGEMIIFTWTNLAVHASLTNTIRVTASTSALVTNFASVYSPFIDLAPTNNTNQLVLVIAGEDLALGMTTSETNVLVGDTVVSWITVTNLGPSTNGPVFITNVFSTNWTDIAAQVAGTYVVTNTGTNILLVMDLGLLQTNQSATAIVTAVALNGSSLATQFAVVTSQDVDTNLANNSAGFVYFVNDEELAIGLATPPSVNLGVPFTYTMSVTNFGLSYTGLITVTNTLPTNVQPLSASQSQGSSAIGGNQIVFTLGTLGPGQISTLAVSALALSLPTSAEIVAQVSSTVFDTNSANEGVINLVTVNGEDLSVTLSVFPTTAQVGQAATFTGQVSNLGLSTNAVVLVTNTFSTNLGSITVLQPANYTVNQNMVVFNLGTLNVNQTVPIMLMATPLSTGSGTDTAVVDGLNFDPNLANNSATATVTITPALPMISNLVVTALASSAFVTWNTDFPATAQVVYGPTAAYGSFSPASTAAGTSHAFLLSGLTGGAEYYFEALSWVGTKLYTTNGSFSTTNLLILDTPDARYTGVWTAGSVANGAYHTNYQTAATTTGSPTAWAIYEPTIPAAGLYNVSIWHPQNSGFTTNAQVYIFGATNQLFASVNETINGGGWQPLASNVYFASGTNGNVTIYNNTGETGQSVAANAMMWSYVAAQDYPTNGVVPAWWANFYFGANANGSVSGSADPDGDGYDNYAEYVFGTDPTDAASHLNFSVAAGPGNSVIVTFSPCQGGRAYELEAVTNLANPAWITLTNGFTVTTNGAGVFTVQPGNASGVIYRLSAQVIP